MSTGQSRSRFAAVISLVTLLASPIVLRANTETWEWEGVKRVVALSDIHGQYTKMVALLQAARLVDGQLNWSGGLTHLVICGDLVDRGPGDRSTLDLARKIQGQAEAAGGRVHVLLGNHEVMNLTRDVRFVSKESFSEWADDETAEERKKSLSKFHATKSSEGFGGGEAFDDEFPPGYFAHRRSWAPDGEYGAWLLGQPTVVKVNDTVFLHGGLTESVAALGLPEINRRMSSSIREFISGADDLGDRVTWPAEYSDIRRAAEALEKGRGKDAEAAKRIIRAREDLAFAPGGPVWYRGTSVESERLEADRITEVLNLLDANTEVLGHTVTKTGRISSRFNGRLYRVDVGTGYGRKPYALVLANDAIRVLDPATGTLSDPIVESPQGEGWPHGEEDLSDEEIEKFLRRANIKSFEDDELGGVPLRVLVLEGNDMSFRALNGWAQETAAEAAAQGREATRRYQHQVAAYRLDRMLGLHLVPVSVERKVEGREGAVQIWMQAAVDIATLESYGGGDMILEFDEQIAQARAFSALIGLEKRIDEGRIILPSSQRIMIMDNGIAFTERGEIELYMPEGCGPVGAGFQNGLRRLESGALKKELGKLLSKAQLDAILARRDKLVAECVDPDPDWSVQKIREMRERELAQD